MRKPKDPQEQKKSMCLGKEVIQDTGREVKTEGQDPLHLPCDREDTSQEDGRSLSLGDVGVEKTCPTLNASHPLHLGDCSQLGPDSELCPRCLTDTAGCPGPLCIVRCT